MADPNCVNVAWIACGRKRPFRSRKSAADAATKLRQVYGNHLKPYRCERCGSWHLTKGGK